jgi:hypothetical protein
MPATEQTWRDQKRMHVIFGVTGILMLLTTIWMLAVDHRREWKDYQRTFRNVESASIEYRIRQQDNEQFQRDLHEREVELAAAQREVPPAESIEHFREILEDEAVQRGVKPPDFSPVDKQYQDLVATADKAGSDEKSAKEVADKRSRLIQQLEQFVADAKFRESNYLREKKFQAAYFDVDRSVYEIGVGNELPDNKLEKIEEGVKKTKEKVDERSALVENSKVQRIKLERVLGQIVAHEARARKELEDQQAKLGQLTKAYDERRDSFSKELFAMPIIDAFGRPLKIEQIWLPRLTINYNFRDVPRFDRCTTCHQGLDKTLPGSAVEPAYRRQHEVDLTLVTPAEAPAADAADSSSKAEFEGKALWSPEEKALGDGLGLHLADRGLIHDDDVTVSVVRPLSVAAKAGVNVGDVLLEINGVKVLSKKIAYRYLVDNVAWGQPIQLKVQRGLPNPYASHPRLDLFVGSLSPHKTQEVGCTICHEGQGSATDFKWASHSPDSPGEASRWKHDHGWFDNHHWIFPMNPKRFAESSCLKCHHDVAELEPSERFPDPPAPQLMAGYDLIRQYGCYGCHEINGFDGPSRRIGPDLRSEPNYSAAAQALLAGGDLNAEEKSLAEKIVYQPEDDRSRRTLVESLRVAAQAQAGVKSAVEAEADAPPAQPLPRISLATRKLATVLEDVESPGKLRKVGPSLRHVASKVDFDFLYSWIRRPKDFRPTTKMPQFFVLWDHLDGEGLNASKEFEPIEVRGISEYLLAKSQPFDYYESPRGVTEKASAERGKQLFETRGCLACHQHADFPQGKMRQGPNLTNLGGKLDRPGNKGGRQWLYSWLRNPSNYHPRTLMPNLILEPIDDGNGKVSDPAADISAFLLASADWQPANVPGRTLTAEEREALFKLAFDHLKDAYPKRQAKQYLEHGIPESLGGEIKGDDIELLGEASGDEQVRKQLLYVGRRSISKYGCSGCHDVPGYEDVKPIGTGLADWGRKSADKLAFEQIAQYILQGHGQEKIPTTGPVDSDDAAYVGSHSLLDTSDEVEMAHEEGAHELNFAEMPAAVGFFMEKLMGHQREGFIWQKLRAPRSYDYKKTENKGYNERLRMPQFNIDAEQREQVITFVLGLVAEPPAQQYVYKSQPRRAAIAEGLKVIEKFNCKGCHAFQMDRLELAYEPGDFSDPPKFDDYAFLESHVTPQQVKASLETDNRGLRHAALVGMAVVNEKTGEPELVDSDGSPIDPDDKTSPAFQKFTPWETAVINGKIRPAGLQNLFVPMSRVVKQYPTSEQLRENPVGYGGYLPRLIYAAVLAAERQVNPNAKGDEAWGWLPPPLVGEGRKVQTDWLHDFLLDPYPIRPAVVLRMPKFNMSTNEASALVNYFAAIDNAEYPYDFDPRTREGYLASKEREEDHPHRLGDALKIVTDNNYCVKCHPIGDFEPAGSARAKGPHLDQVYKRLRPDFALRWIANPKRILPYTGMPVNIPPNKPASDVLYPGSSLEQVNAVVDLLMNWDRFIESRLPIKPLIKTAPAAATEGPPASKAGARTNRQEVLR